MTRSSSSRCARISRRCRRGCSLGSSASRKPRRCPRVRHASRASWCCPRKPSEVVVNDPTLQRLSAPLKRALGDAVGPLEPTSASEDFGVYGRVAGAPSVQLRIGASDPAEWAKAKEAGTLPPGPHNAAFALVREPTIRSGVSALTLSALELLGKAREQG